MNRKNFRFVSTSLLSIAMLGGAWVYGQGTNGGSASPTPSGSPGATGQFGVLGPCPAPVVTATPLASPTESATPLVSPTPTESASPGAAGGVEATATPSASASPGAAAQCISIEIPAGATGQGPAAYGVNPQVIPPNTTVTWVNNDSMAHTVTANDGSFDSGTLQPGQSFSQTFVNEGTFPYFCAIHGQASMSGAIQVQSTSASPTPVITATPLVSATPIATPSASATAGAGSTPLGGDAGGSAAQTG